MLRVCVLITFRLAQVLGHGNMIYPPIFQDFKKIGLDVDKAKRGHGGFIGCERDDPSNGVFQSCALRWFTNYTMIPTGQKMTLPENMRTVKRSLVDEKNPWYAPGTAHVFSPCGVNGGNPEGCGEFKNELKEFCARGGESYGVSAEKYYTNRKVPVTVWPKGSVQNAAFTLSANHGGGYQYRICKVPAEGIAGVTEECFQKTPLQFHGSNHRIVYNSNETNWKSIPARDSSIGTKPVDSTWRRNPIPLCKDVDGGLYGYYKQLDNSCPYGTMFPAPLPGLNGRGFFEQDKAFNQVFKWAVVDQVEVPDNIEEGDYVLSWRWDCEETPQIWNTCSAIKVTGGDGDDGIGDE